MFILKLFLFYLFFQDTFAVYDNHYQKLININGNTEGITVGKKIKTKQKQNNDVLFLPSELPR